MLVTLQPKNSSETDEVNWLKK